MVVAIFTELGGARRAGKDFKVTWREASNEGVNFYDGELTPVGTMLFEQKYWGMSPNTFYSLEACETH